MKKVMIVLGIALISLGIIAGCGKSKEEGKSKKTREIKAILGKWREVDGIHTIEFFKDGTVVFVKVRRDNPYTWTGSYKFVGDKRIKIDEFDTGPAYQTIVFEISFSEGQLILTMPTGETKKYRRYTERDKLNEKKLRQIMEAKEEARKRR